MESKKGLLAYLLIGIIVIGTIGYFWYYNQQKNNIEIEADDILYINGVNEIKINADKSYSYKFYVNDENIAEFTQESVKGQNVTNNLNVKKKGNITIYAQVYDDNKIIKTLRKEITTCGDLKTNLDLKSSYNIKVGDEVLIVPEKNDKCLETVMITSNNGDIIEVIDNTKIKGIKAGKTSITVQSSGIVYMSDIVVSGNGKTPVSTKPIPVEGIKINSGDIELEIGQTKKASISLIPSNATNKKVVWESGNPNIATVNNGTIEGKQVGSTEINVRTEDGGHAASFKVNVIEKKSTNVNNVSVNGIAVYPASTIVLVNNKAKLGYTLSPSNATNKSVTWKSSNTSVATVDANGVVTGKKAGTANITVTTQDGNKTATSKITVVNNEVRVTGISLNKGNVDLKVGENYGFVATISPSNATNRNVTWKSSNTNVATVSANGMVTAKGAGTTNITATTQDGGKMALGVVRVFANSIGVTGISLNKTSASITVGNTITLTPTISPSNATNKNVTWKSSNTSVATVSGGVVTGKGAGTATITVSTNDGNKTANCIVTVTSITNPTTPISSTISVTGVTISPSNLSLTVGSAGILTAIITPSNATNKSVIWTSSNTSIATVSNGVVTGIGAGTTTITATSVDGSKKATAVVSVVSQTPTNTTGSSSGYASNYIGPSSTSNVTAQYDSATLKYWIEKPGTYAITHVWVKDAYNQFKTAIPNGKIGSLANASTILNKEISSKGYSKKGLVAFNASAFVGNGFNSDYPSVYNGSSVSPIVILDGKVLRNSTNKAIPESRASRKTYGLTRSGYLSYYSYTANGIAQNQAVAQQVINDGVRYTFAFTPVLISYGSISTSSSGTNNMRQALCQIDANNFAIYTSTSSSDSPSHLQVAQRLQAIGCRTAFALDGSESVSGYYKTNSSSVKTIRSSSRSVADIIYFVEQ